MSNFIVPDKPIYNAEIRKFETSDPAHADLFNSVTQNLINNIQYVKNKLDGILKVEDSDIDLILEGLASEEDESDFSAGEDNPIGNFEIVTEEDIQNVLNS